MDSAKEHIKRMIKAWENKKQRNLDSNSETEMLMDLKDVEEEVKNFLEILENGENSWWQIILGLNLEI